MTTKASVPLSLTLKMTFDCDDRLIGYLFHQVGWFEMYHVFLMVWFQITFWRQKLWQVTVPQVGIPMSVTWKELDMPEYIFWYTVYPIIITSNTSYQPSSSNFVIYEQFIHSLITSPRAVICV